LLGAIYHHNRLSSGPAVFWCGSVY
jgi:hypothetical protein